MSFASGFFSFNGLLNIAAAGGTICSFYLTHDMEIANEADVVLRMSDGKIE